MYRYSGLFYVRVEEFRVAFGVAIVFLWHVLCGSVERVPSRKHREYTTTALLLAFMKFNLI